MENFTSLFTDVSGVSCSLLFARNLEPRVLILIHQALKISNRGEVPRGGDGSLENVAPLEDKLTYNKYNTILVTRDSMQMNRREVEGMYNKPVTKVAARDGTGGNCFIYSI